MPMFVALWSRDTTKKVSSSEAAKLKSTVMNIEIQAVMDAISKAAAKMEAVGSSIPSLGKGRVKGIFVAPEYMMSRFQDDTQTYNQPDSISAAAKDVVLKLLMGESAKRKGLLLVPGSIAYHRPLSAASAEKKEKWVKALDAHAEWATKNTKFSPENTIVSYQKGTDNDPAVKRALLTGATTRDDVRVVRNRAYVLLEGGKVASYAKTAEIEETTANGIFIPGKSVGTKSIEDIEFGFELCMDHGKRILREHLTPLKKQVDIHVVASASVPNNPSGMAMSKDGFFIHASSDNAETSVWHRKTTLGNAPEKADMTAVGTELGTKREVYLGKEDVGESPLHYFLIDFPKAVAAKADGSK
jgi:hypothetical protein